MNEDTKRLGSALQAAREGRRPKMGQAQVADALEVSRTTVQNIEGGKFARINATIREYARLVGWPDGAVERVLAGGPVLAPAPQPEEDSSGAPPQFGKLGLTPEVEFELHAGETLGSTVINLGPDEDDGHLIVVLQGKKGASADEVARIAERYRKARFYLQGLASTEPDEVADS